MSMSISTLGSLKLRLAGSTSLLAILILSVAPVSAKTDRQKPKLVVVLYADDNDGRPGNVLFDRGLRATLMADSPDPVEIHSEFLDVSRFSDPGYQQQLAEFLRLKYVRRKIDLIITEFSSTLDFAVAQRDRMFPGVPVVFGAVDEREIVARKLPPDMIGVPIKMDMLATLDLALAHHPRTQRVFVITGKSPVDAQWEAEARRAFRGYEGNLEFVYLSGLPMDELLKRVATLTEHSIAYYLHVFEDGAGSTFVSTDVLERLAATAGVPLYGHADTYVGRGIVGGRVFSYEAEGGNAAKLGLRILAGENPRNLPPPQTSENTYQFDWRQLQRWGITKDRLPVGSVVRFEEPGFWYLYRWHLIGIISLCVIEGLLIFRLTVERINRQRAEARFRQMVEAAPNGILMVDRKGRIALANNQIEKLFGYRKEELLSQSVEMLMPEQVRSRYAAYRNHFFESPEARPMGAGRELFGLRKDGRQFAVEIGLSHVSTDAGLFVLASVSDISERQQAEQGLRESQHELQILTGRLLQAQESERRRIARELHDDLNQRLALLSVEIDILARRPTVSSGQFCEQLHELSTEVRQISSSVHELSHRLHPAKLEHLGLESAVRGLCKEISLHHELAIAFRSHDLPDEISEDTALCLYRIVQEAICNAIKHGNAARLEVDLSIHDEDICLRIADDGVGFDPSLVEESDGLGLLSMRERLRLVNGTIAIDTRPSEGTRIEVRVPCDVAAFDTGQLQESMATIL
jgi:PAS domain S-box-containing protein